MDTLIELIVRGIIALLSGGGKYEKNQPPRPTPQPQRPPPPPPTQQQWQNPFAKNQRGRAQPQRQSPAARQQLSQRAQQQLRRKPQLPGQRRTMPPPIPTAAPVPRVSPVSQTTAAVPTKPGAATSGPQPTITASGIRQLMLTRKSALRTIYVLSEVIGPPLSLR